MFTSQWNDFKERFSKKHRPEITELDAFWNSGASALFHATLLMRHTKNNKIYLYDIMEIKKKRAFATNSLGTFQKRDYVLK